MVFFDRSAAALRFTGRHAIAITIVALCLFYGYTTLVWLSIDHRPPRADESTYFRISLYSYRCLLAGHPIDALNLRSVSSTKPGGVEFVSALSYFVVGEGEHTAIFLVNVGSMLLTALGLFVLSRVLYGTLLPGAVTIFWLLSLRCLIVWSGYYQIDLPLMAAVTFTIALCAYLTKTGFTDVRAALALLATIAIGLSVKHMYAAYAGPPLVLFAVWMIVSGETSLLERLRNRRVAIACAVMGAAIGLAYHILNFHIVAEQVYRAIHPPDQGAIIYAHSIPKLFLELLPNVPALHVALFATGCALSFYLSRRLVLFPILLIAGGWLGVSVATQQPWSYYLFPLLPSFGLICASVLAIYRIAPKFRPACVITAVSLIVFLAGVYLDRRMGTTNPVRLLRAATLLGKPASEVTSNPLSDVDYWSAGAVDGNAAFLPYPHDWKESEMISYIGSIVRSRITPARVALLTRTEFLSDYNISYLLYKAHLETKAYMGDGTPLQLVKTAEDVFTLGDILIFKQPTAFSPMEARNPWTKPADQSFQQVLANDGQMLKMHGYVFGKSFPLPDHTFAYIWYKPDDGSLRLLDILDQANVNPIRNNAAVWNMKCAGQIRRVLFEHPVPPPGEMTVSWRVRVRPGAHLQFGIGMSEEVWDPRKGDGVEFELRVRKDGKEEQLLSKYIDPKNDAKDRRWFDYDLGLNITREQDVEVKFITRPGAAGDITSDHAGWSEPRIIY